MSLLRLIRLIFGALLLAPFVVLFAWCKFWEKIGDATDYFLERTNWVCPEKGKDGEKIIGFGRKEGEK